MSWETFILSSNIEYCTGSVNVLGYFVSLLPVILMSIAYNTIVWNDYDDSWFRNL